MSTAARSGTLTFLFADLRDYTAWVERHGDDAAAELIAEYRRIVRGELAKTGGGEIKTEGDSFYLVFPSARLALQCAIGIMRSADKASASHPDRPIRIGIGVHAGEPVAHEGQYIGSAVNIAARLAATAGAGELLVSEIVRGLVRTVGVAPMRERERVALKGVDDPPRIFAVEWRDSIRESKPVQSTVLAPAAPQEQTLLCPELVGRDAELARLDGRLREAKAGQGRTLLLSGEAGQGKTALLRAFVERARAGGVTVLVGECIEVEGRRPFSPFVDIARGELRQLESGHLKDSLRKHIADFLGLFSEGPRLEQVIGRLGAPDRYHVHSEFATLFGEMASIRPVLLAVEDLHWADEASLELFPYLAHKLRDVPVLLVGTYRSDELHRLHPLRPVLAELTRSRLAEDLALRKLTLEQVERFLRATLRLDREPTADFLAAIHERCEGNPFFMEEVLKALVERGDIAYRGDGSWRRTKEVRDIAIPGSIRAAVQERLQTLDDEGQRALQIAAVIGRRFDFDLLRAVAGVAEPDLLGYLRRAIDAQLVVEEPGDDRAEQYAFRHALTRETVASDLLHRERRLLHRQIGETMEGLAGADPIRRVEELAYHFDEAGERARALRYHDLAASEAMHTYAFAAAVRHLERAIELTPEGGPGLALLHLRLVDAAAAIDDYPRALRAATEGRRAAEAAGDRATAVKCVVALSIGQSIIGDSSKAHEYALEAVRVAEPLGETAELADASGEVARLMMIDTKYEEAERWGERALVAARTTKNLNATAHVTNTLGLARVARGRVDEGIQLLRESLRMGQELGDPYVIGRAYNNLFSAMFDGVAAESARPILDEWVAWESKLGWRDSSYYQSQVAFGDGAWNAVDRLAREAPPGSIWWTLTQTVFATSLTAREGPEHGRPVVDDARRVGRTSLGAHQLMLARRLAEFEVLAGDLERAVADVDSVPPPASAFLSSACMTACGLWAAGRLGDEAARDRIAARLASAEHQLVSGKGGVAFVEAERAASAGDLASAAAHFAESASLFDSFLSPIEATLARLRCVDQLGASGDAERARTTFADALAFWRRVGAAWYLERLADWGRERRLPGF